MGKFAEHTVVTVANSELELKRTLKRYGVERIAIFSEPGVASVAFEKDETPVRLTVAAPPLQTYLLDQLERLFPGAIELYEWQRKEALRRAQKRWEQEERRIWRVLIMVVKATFELAEELGFEQAFTPHVVTPSGQTVAEWLLPRMDEMRRNGTMPDPFVGLTRPGLPKP